MRDKKIILAIKVTELFGIKKKILQYLFMIRHINSIKFLLDIRLKGSPNPLRVFFLWLMLKVSLCRKAVTPERKVNKSTHLNQKSWLCFQRVQPSQMQIGMLGHRCIELEYRNLGSV